MLNIHLHKEELMEVSIVRVETLCSPSFIHSGWLSECVILGQEKDLKSSKSMVLSLSRAPCKPVIKKKGALLVCWHVNTDSIFKHLFLPHSMGGLVMPSPKHCLSW